MNPVPEKMQTLGKIAFRGRLDSNFYTRQDLDIFSPGVFQIRFHAINGVMVRKGNDAKTTLSGKGKNFEGRITAVRGVGVDMEIDIHMPLRCREPFPMPLPWSCSRCIGW